MCVHGSFGADGPAGAADAASRRAPDRARPDGRRAGRRAGSPMPGRGHVQRRVRSSSSCDSSSKFDEAWSLVGGVTNRRPDEKRGCCPVNLEGPTASERRCLTSGAAGAAKQSERGLWVRLIRDGVPGELRLGCPRPPEPKGARPDKGSVDDLAVENDVGNLALRDLAWTVGHDTIFGLGLLRWPLPSSWWVDHLGGGPRVETVWAGSCCSRLTSTTVSSRPLPSWSAARTARWWPPSMDGARCGCAACRWRDGRSR
jgi:hypothetical protein